MGKKMCPWLGFKPYAEEDAQFFNGRSEAIKALLKVIKTRTVTVCYAESGIGKSSLINAGLVPNLREQNYLPISIRFNFDEFKGKEKEEIMALLCNQILATFHESKNNFEEKNEPYKLIWDIPNEFHRPNIYDLWKALRSIPKVAVLFNGFEYFNIYKPFLIFDQFEQMLYDSNSQFVIESFFNLLKSLVLNDTFGDDYYDMKAKGEIEDNEDMFKVLVSIRQEYIGVLDYWCMSRVPMPSLHDNRYSLQPLTTHEAKEVVLLKGYDIFENAVDKIIEIAKENNTVSSILLSVICRSLYEQAPFKDGEIAKVSEVEVDKKKESIIEDYYTKQLEKVKSENGSLLTEEIISQIEDVLVSDDGKRSLLAVKNERLQGVVFTEAIKIVLENNGIIRSDKIGGTTFIELIHDRVADAVLERKKERKKQKNREQRRLTNLKKYKSKQNILTLPGRHLIDNCGFDFSEDNSRSIVSANSKDQLIRQNISSIHSREYDGSDNVFIADILNQIVGNNKLYLQFGGSSTKDGYKALGIDTTLVNTQRTIDGIVFYDSETCLSPICSAEGFYGINIVHDSDGNERARVYKHSKDGINVSGVSCYEIAEYSKDGFPLKILYKNEHNEPCKHFDGNYGIEFQYDDYGNEINRRFLAKDGKSPCKIYNQVYGLKSEYDDKDRLILQYFVDQNGEIIEDAYGHVGIKIIYDEETGDKSKIEYIGKDREICLNPYGYSIVTIIYKNGKTYQYRYYGLDGKTLVRRIDGGLYYGILEIVGYDDCDRIIGYILRDVDESLILKLLFSYDNTGRLTDTKYYVEEGIQSINPTTGIHHVHYDYYSNGLLKSQSHFGINGTPTEDINGFHKAIFEYDDHGRLSKRHFFKSDANSPGSSQIFEYKSDAQCIVRDITYSQNPNGISVESEEKQEWLINHKFQAKEIIFGEKNDFIPGRPVKVKYRYNIAGDVSEYRLFDIESDKSIANEDGDYGWRIVTDNNSGENRTLLLDENGNCSKNKHTYAIIARNNIKYQGEECAATSYFDEDNNPVIGELGCHTIIESQPFYNDEFNRQVFFLDSQNSPCNCENGYSKQVFKEEQISITEIKRTVSFWGADDSPQINKLLGFHKREQIISVEKGMETSRSFMDEKSNLINVSEGFAKQTCKRYDSFKTLWYYPFEDHEVIRFYDEKDEKVDVDYTIMDKTYHAYKFVVPLDYSSFLKVKSTSGKIWIDWGKIWKMIVPLVSIIIIIGYLLFKILKNSIYAPFNKLFNLISPQKPIKVDTSTIIKVAEVFNEVKKGNSSIVAPAKSIGLLRGYWLVQWNDWIYSNRDDNTANEFEKVFNLSDDKKKITLYDPNEKRFFHICIKEKNLGLRIQDAEVPTYEVSEMIEKWCTDNYHESKEDVPLINMPN